MSSLPCCMVSHLRLNSTEILIFSTLFEEPIPQQPALTTAGTFTCDKA